MPVHAESQIPTWINTYHPTFYVSLTDKENDAYTRNSGNEKDDWKPKFTQLGDAMTSWKNISRQDSVSNLISALYSYVLLNLNFGTSFSATTVTALVVFDINGFITSTLARSVDYYNDLVEDPPSSDIWTSAKMTADITAVGNNTVEADKINTAFNTSKAVIGPFMSNILFNDVTPTASASKQQVGIEIFNNLDYKKVYQNLNVGSLTLPGYIT